MMTTSKNKRAFHFYMDYLRSNCRSVDSAYVTRPSDAKRQAEKDILERMQSEGGNSYRILSHSGFVFTCGYVIPDVDNGHDVLVVDTRDNTYRITIDGEYNYWRG